MQSFVDVCNYIGLSQKELSNGIEIAQSDISKLENGNTNLLIKIFQKLVSDIGK